MSGEITASGSSDDVRTWVDTDPTPVERFFRVTTSGLWKHGFQHRAYGVEHVPREGGFILVPNHSSYLDPFLQVYGQHRTVRFMAKSSLFDVPLLRTIVRKGGAFPVKRGQGDSGAIDLAHKILQSGQVLVVYPEGTRFRESLELGPARSGAARLALEAGVPVVPVATWGVKRRGLYGRKWFQRPRVTIVYGEPIHFDDLEPSRENAAVARDRIWAAVEELYARARELDAAR